MKIHPAGNNSVDDWLGFVSFHGGGRGRIIHSHQKWTKWGFLWGTDPASGVPGQQEPGTTGNRHRCSAQLSGSAKAVCQQKMYFLALALPSFLARSDPLAPLSLLFLAIPWQMQGSTKQTGMMMLSRLLQPGCILGTCPCITRTHHPPPGEPRGSGGFQDPNLLSLLRAYKWVAALFMKCWVEGYWGFQFH